MNHHILSVQSVVVAPRQASKQEGASPTWALGNRRRRRGRRGRRKRRSSSSSSSLSPSSKDNDESLRICSSAFGALEGLLKICHNQQHKRYVSAKKGIIVQQITEKFILLSFNHKRKVHTIQPSFKNATVQAQNLG